VNAAPESTRFGWTAARVGDALHLDHHNFLFGLWAANRWNPASGRSDLSAAFDLTKAFPTS
jgi:hypothetical protein